MYYAHIYKVRTGSWLLMVTLSADISTGVLAESIYASKADAKRAAKLANAKAWNY